MIKRRYRIGTYPWHQHNHAELLRSGNSFFSSLLESIEAATEEILIQVYILEPDKTGMAIIDALFQAAQRGVKVNILADAYGSTNLKNNIPARLLHPCISLRFYAPVKILSKLQMGMRLHHKIFVIDKQVAFTGGINLADHYSGFDGREPWLDYGMKLQGEIVKDLWKICLETGSGFLRKNNLLLSGFSLPSIYQGNIKIRALQNHWFKARFAISKQYRNQIRFAKEELVIMNSYFIPSRALKRLLKNAAKRGVAVKLILGGVSDVPTVRNATRFFYGDLLKAGIKIFEYQKSVLHAKLALSDGNWICLGSYNLNHLSDFGSIECNLEMLDETFYRTTKQELEAICKQDCQEIQAHTFEQSNTLFLKIRDYLSYLLIRASLRILFLLQRRSKRISEIE